MQRAGPVDRIETVIVANLGEARPYFISAVRRQHAAYWYHRCTLWMSRYCYLFVLHLRYWLSPQLCWEHFFLLLLSVRIHWNGTRSDTTIGFIVVWTNRGSLPICQLESVHFHTPLICVTGTYVPVELGNKRKYAISKPFTVKRFVTLFP